MTWPTALLDPGVTPTGLKGPTGAPAGRRFDVYRNNVLSSLVAAMREGFPVIQRLVGEDFFGALATEFIRRHPPASPVLSRYGDEFPAFLDAFPPVAHLPYLADTARLELALRRAYHAADTQPIAAEGLSHPDIDAARLTLAPSVSVLVSPFPIYSIWRANTDRTAPKPTPGAQAVLVTRPDWDPVAEPVPLPEARFFQALSTAPFAQAAAEPDLDLAQALTRLLARKAIIQIEVTP